MFITAVPITKLFAWGEGDSGGHVLRETTSRGEKRNVLIVSVLLPRAICLALRSKTQRRIEVLGMRWQTTLMHVGT